MTKPVEILQMYFGNHHIKTKILNNEWIKLRKWIRNKKKNHLKQRKRSGHFNMRCETIQWNHIYVMIMKMSQWMCRNQCKMWSRCRWYLLRNRSSWKYIALFLLKRSLITRLFRIMLKTMTTKLTSPKDKKHNTNCKISGQHVQYLCIP